jgi:hypothetical protein
VKRFFKVLVTVMSIIMISCSGNKTFNEEDIIIENDQVKLVISKGGYAKSLLYKPANEECLTLGKKIPISTITEDRPFQHNLLLTYSTQETTFKANSVRREGDKLIIGFDLITWEAVIKLTISSQYIGFTLESLKDINRGTDITEPLISGMWFLQLPVRNRTYFGEWLNVIWDDQMAVNLLGADPYARIDSEEGEGYRILKAGVVEKVKLTSVCAALITCSTDQLLDNIARVEEDYNLPHGVKSRRHELYNLSYYWSPNVTPLNIDSHLKYARMGGFRTFMIYYPSFIKEGRGYSYLGNYEFRKEYPNGMDDLKAMVAKIKNAGMVPGFHFLHTHIGIGSKYITPIPDHRLNLRKTFTLAAPLGKKDTTIYIEQNPRDVMMADNRRILRLGTELISYKDYTTDPPYLFTGCERGVYQTIVNSQPAGYIFGLLDVSEFGATSIYIDQNSSIQEEIAQKLAEFYKAGFRFVYYDGSEGLNPPFWFNIANAQYIVHNKLKPEPIFAEGSAKTHFSWHIMSRANAFDTYRPEKQKEETRKNAAEEAPRMKKNFTSINFGWLDYVLPGENTIGTQPDILEYVTSRAAAWDCPISIKAYAERFDRHPRTADNLEVLRRWEEVRAQHWLTDEQKQMLKNLDQEHTLLLNEKNEFELVPCNQIMNTVKGSREVRAYTFERKGDLYVVYWHISADKKLELPVNSKDIVLLPVLGQELPVHSGMNGETSILPVGKIRFIKTNKLTKDELVAAFENAKIMAQMDN